MNTELSMTDGRESGKNFMNKAENRRWFLLGIRHGIPIGLGYFAVAFTIGIKAREIGLSALQAAGMSFMMHASAGEVAALQVISAGTGYLEMALTELIINLRYLLMSCALTQKLSEKMKFGHRFLISYFITDEIFGISSTVDGKLNPFYNYGAACTASPGWVLGTFLGAIVGNILPNNVASAMSIAVYGMFLAIVIPPAKKNRTIAVIVAVSMLCSLGLDFLSKRLTMLTSGTRIILLTVVIAGVAAYLRPIREGGAEGES